MRSLDGFLLLEPGEVAELALAARRCVPDGPAQHPRDLFLAAVADALEHAAGLRGGEPVGLAIRACLESSVPEVPPVPVRPTSVRSTRSA